MGMESALKDKMGEIIARALAKSKENLRGELSNLETTIKQTIKNCMGMLDKAHSDLDATEISVLASQLPKEVGSAAIAGTTPAVSENTVIRPAKVYVDSEYKPRKYDVFLCLLFLRLLAMHSPMRGLLSM